MNKKTEVFSKEQIEKDKGYVIQWGSNCYAFVRSEEAVYNMKTGRKLKWQWTEMCSSDSMKTKYSKNCFVRFSNGAGKQSRRIRLKEFLAGPEYVYGQKELPVYMEEYDLQEA